MPGRKESSRYKKKRKGFDGVQKQNMPVHHQQQTATSAASNDSTSSTRYNDQLKQNTSPDKLNRSVEKIERNCLLKTKERKQNLYKEKSIHRVRSDCL